MSSTFLSLQAGVSVARLVAITVEAIAVLVGYAVISAATAGLASLVYRWYFTERIPKGVSALVGTAAVTGLLTVAKLTAEETALLQLDIVVVNVGAIAVAVVASLLGWHLGDAVATNVFAVAGAKELEGEVSKVVRSVGRVTAVTLPETIDDMEEHDSVSADKKAAIAGKTLLFPRRLTVEELRDRLATRLKDDYGVGYVDVEFDEEGAVDYLAVGSRMAGIGPTLAPGTAVVAVEADPADGASPGDIVQVWTDAETPEQVVTAELRATADDVATLAVDAADASKLSPGRSYRLVTLPAEPQTDREFASLLRAAEETMGAVTVRAESTLVGQSVSDLGATVAAVRPRGGTVEAIPSRKRTLAAGDVLYVIARPEELRRLETAAQAQPSSVVAGE